MKFAVSGKLDAKYLLKYDRTTTITSTEISDFESIKDSFEEFKHVQVEDIENSSTFFRVAGGYLKMMGNNIEGVNVKEFKAAMDSFEGYDVYRIVSPQIQSTGENARTIKVKIQQSIENMMFADVEKTQNGGENK